MEMTVVVTALPTIGCDFPSAMSWLPWLTTASLMAAAVAMPLGGRLADEWGARRAFLAGMVFFTSGSLLAGLVGLVLPKSMSLLIGLRALQGFGGGTFAPVGLKLISAELKGRKRTQTIGLAGMVGPVAAVAGPNIGGVLVSHYPWQVIFLLNAGAGLFIAFAAAALWPAAEPPPARRRRGPLQAFDFPGMVMFSGLIVSFMVALTLGRETSFGSPVVITLLALGVILALSVVVAEARTANPFLEPAFFRTRGMRVILGLSFLQGVTMYSTLLFMSAYVQMHPVIHASPAQAGAILTPAALGQVITALLAGRILPKVGYRAAVVAGMTVTAASVLGLGTGTTSLTVLTLLLLTSRVGATLAGLPLAAAGLEANVARAGAISGLRQLANVVGGVVGPVALSAAYPLGGGNGVTPWAFVTIGLLLLLALPFSFLMPVREAETVKPPGVGSASSVG